MSGQRGEHLSDGSIVALLDGELLLPERVTAERHLSDCERCADLLTRQRAAERALAWLLQDDEPLVDEPLTSPSRWELRPVVRVAGASVLAGAATGALVVAGLLLRRGRRGTPQAA